MIDRIENHSKQQGFPRSRLPAFTTEEINRIRGTSDFFGINSYTSNLVTRNDRNNSAGHPIPSFQHDMGVIETLNEIWPKSGSVWLRVSKQGAMVQFRTRSNCLKCYIIVAVPIGNVQITYVD